MHVNDNSREMHPIKPLSDTNSVDCDVQSNHAEIGLTTPEGSVINSWNLGNPEYSMTCLPGPLKQGHPYVYESFDKEKTVRVLLEKHQSQVKTIASRFSADRVALQVILEGYAEFFRDLEAGLEYLNKPFTLFYNRQSAREHPKWNHSGILVNLNVYMVLIRGFFDSGKYREGERDEEYSVPFLQVMHKRSERCYFICAVHLPGTASPNPENGLRILRDRVNEIWNSYKQESDLIAIGDFKSTPENIQRETGLTVITPEYPTHVNHDRQAANYDNAIVLKGNPSREYKVSDEAALSEASRALIRSIR